MLSSFMRVLCAGEPERAPAPKCHQSVDSAQTVDTSGSPYGIWTHQGLKLRLFGPHLLWRRLSLLTCSAKEELHPPDFPDVMAADRRHVLPLRDEDEVRARDEVTHAHKAVARPGLLQAVPLELCDARGDAQSIQLCEYPAPGRSSRAARGVQVMSELGTDGA